MCTSVSSFDWVLIYEGHSTDAADLIVAFTGLCPGLGSTFLKAET